MNHICDTGLVYVDKVETMTDTGYLSGVMDNYIAKL